MFERQSGGTAAILVGLDLGRQGYEESLDELKLLASSAGIDARVVVRGRRERPDPSTFAGRGKVEEIRQALEQFGARLVVFNHELSAGQERNLERSLGCRVIDRTSLILELFARRAKSHEGKLQVELAQLEYAATRLVRGWTHLERQRGGIGLRGGPGETQIEVDRRLIARRVKTLKDKLVKFRRQRDVQRRSRSRGRVTSVSLVGYTNAGKSTLFNCLTKAGVLSADKLFATLDTTTRRVYLPGAGAVVLSDTVGFIRDLPHSLVAAFRATLEETVQADLLLHVVDAASPTREQNIAEVNKVLEEIGAESVPQILVSNKIDLNGTAPGLERDEYGKISRVRLSAKTGDGVETLRQALVEAIASRHPSAIQHAALHTA
ncbi:MAG: GTPase HflX [Betaproteobacteria bacterium RIFCSPLOWO2_02_FULL_64_12]|nr:MAG: GTPase HflX [Betaproteobacteria bacterium RIFCSPLOWO2_02_FULL_64_12]